MRPLAVAALALSTLACSHWQPYDDLGEVRELARRPVGSPHLVETTDVSVAGGFLTTHTHDDGVGITRGLGSASGDSVKQTFCAQTMRIDYEQPVTTRYRESGHVVDYAGGGALVFFGGLMAVMNASFVADWNTNFGSDPFFRDDRPSEAPTVIGIVAAIAGAGLAAYSALELPKGPEPVAEPSTRRWTDEKLVEVQGCQLPGASAPADQSSAAKRLEELKRLHDQGVITDQEYEQKRKAALDSL